LALRLIQVFLPSAQREALHTLILDHAIQETWEDLVSEDRVLTQMLTSAVETEKLLDEMQSKFRHVEGFRILLLPVEASIPRSEVTDAPVRKEDQIEEEKTAPSISQRISREELYSDIEGSTRLSWVYIVMIILSAVVATIGMLRGNVAIVIGAMVIAPLLGPNVALSLATTLGDKDLAQRSVKTTVAGIMVALAFSAMVGMIFQVDPNIPEIASRTAVGLEDLILALAAGSAAVLAFTSGAPSALIGVMVAVALLPPLVTLGMLLGAGFWGKAAGALLLLLTNLICINLSGVVTFLVQGVRPLTWWEANQAKKATRNAILIWVSMLVILTAVITLSRG
jgi:uncharacterized hydrophobic protein (TIGR00341 family)